jgi:hypothetical protein
MAPHKRREILGCIILACIPIQHVSSAYSHFRKIAIPEQPIGKETIQIKVETDESLNLGTIKNDGNRRMKSGKDFKSSKKEKHSKKYGQNYYEGSYYTNSYPPPKIPGPSPTCKFAQE